MDIIEKFLQNYQTKSTNKSYRTAINLFFKVIKKKPDESYFSKHQDYEDDVLRFWRYLTGRPPKSVSMYIAVVKMFLSENDHELPSKFWRTLRGRTKGTRAVTEDKIPKPAEMKLILSHADVRGRALFLTLLQSGMRVGELVKIDTDDVDFTVRPARIRIRAEITKSGNQRYSFIGNEATEAIQAYLKHRSTYLQASINRSKTLQKYYHRTKGKDTHDTRLFPFDDGQIRSIWNRLLMHAKLAERDKRTNFHKMHPHVLRKYFRTHMSLDVPLDVVEALMGHEGYLTDAYRRYSVEQLGEQYLKGEKNISIFTSTSKDVEELQNDRQKDQVRIAELEKKLDEMNQTMLILLAKNQAK